MSALPPKADMRSANRHVRFVPIADIVLRSLDRLIADRKQRLRHKSELGVIHGVTGGGKITPISCAAPDYVLTRLF